MTFHREKFVAAGGPDGGDGGRGGNVVFVADANLSTLMDFRYKRKYAAPERRKRPRQARCSGKDGADDLVIRVPRGTVVRDAADRPGHRGSFRRRARGGGPRRPRRLGQQPFCHPHPPDPQVCQARPARARSWTCSLELKLHRGCGPGGLPQCGQVHPHQLSSRAAQPKIANYHFTTLYPRAGCGARGAGSRALSCADIPGLIEGAAEGVGLGHDFLRHVDRCRLLLHVVDVSGCEGRDPKADFEQINHELAGFSAELADRPQIVLGNKCDIATPEQVEEFKNYIEAKGLTFLPISAATRQGVDNLPALVYSRLKDLPPVKVYEAEYKCPDKSAMPTRPFTVTRTGDHEFTVDAPWLERILAGTNVEDYESLQYFQTQLGDSGILDELVAQGVEEEDTIKIGEYEFDYLY